MIPSSVAISQNSAGAASTMWAVPPRVQSWSKVLMTVSVSSVSVSIAPSRVSVEISCCMTISKAYVLRFSEVVSI